jgi:hypothetical protein
MVMMVMMFIIPHNDKGERRHGKLLIYVLVATTESESEE